MPRLTIIILFCDNDYQYLDRAVSSIKEHIKFNDYEIIAVDNREKEKTPINIEGVRVISKGYNLNCFEGRRFGFENSNGEYIWNFDVDDLMVGDLYLEDFKNKVDFYQIFYRCDKSTGYAQFQKKHLPRGYGWNVWTRFYSAELLKKVYSKIDKPVNVFMFEDRILFDFVSSFKPTYDYIERTIYEYNVSNATNTPKKVKENAGLIKTGFDEYSYLYNLIKKPWIANELKERVKNLLEKS